MKTYSLSDIGHMVVHGRTNGRLAPLTLFWTGSGVEWRVSGSELWVEVEAAYDVYEPWVTVLINGSPVSRQMLSAGRHWLRVFRGMNGQAVKNVRIVKDTQAMSGDPGCRLQLHAVKSDGAFHPVESRPNKIEFIGDSITSGEGAIGAKGEIDWIPMWFSAIHNYTHITAEALNADYRVISQSGWGVLTSWDNNPRCNIPDYYEQVCGLLAGEANASLGARERNDFEVWQPDVVVVNLGTNDAGAFQNPAWRDEETGTTHKQRLNEDGSYHEEDLGAFERAVEQFLAKIRRNNKDARIVWAYGMAGAPLLPAIQHAAQTYSDKSGDNRISVLRLPEMTQETAGSRGHPGEPAHRTAAQALTDHICSEVRFDLKTPKTLE